jgi:CSLREA domain-containing protein
MSGVAVGLLLAALPAAAATITVDTTADAIADDGNCTLREAVRAANLDTAVDACTAGSGADEIVLPEGTFTLSLPGASEDHAMTGDLDLRETVTITGAGADATIVDANDLDRAFDVQNGAATFVDLTMRNGTAPGGEAGGVLRVTNGNAASLTDCVVADGAANSGAGIRVDIGTLELLRTTVRDNTATSSGGGIAVEQSPMTITDSTISGNVADNIGGGLFAGGSSSTFSIMISGSTFTANGAINGGAMFLANESQTTIRNSTLSNNLATGSGGALYQSFGDGVTLANATVTLNIADTGGGIAQDGSSAPIVIRNTILAGNTASDDTSQDCAGTITSAGYNLVESTTGCTFEATTGDIIGESPDLLPLDDYGGPTLTHALDDDSPARRRRLRSDGPARARAPRRQRVRHRRGRAGRHAADDHDDDHHHDDDEQYDHHHHDLHHEHDECRHDDHDEQFLDVYRRAAAAHVDHAPAAGPAGAALPVTGRDRRRAPEAREGGRDARRRAPAAARHARVPRRHAAHLRSGVERDAGGDRVAGRRAADEALGPRRAHRTRAPRRTGNRLRREGRLEEDALPERVGRRAAVVRRRQRRGPEAHPAEGPPHEGEGHAHRARDGPDRDPAAVGPAPRHGRAGDRRRRPMRRRGARRRRLRDEGQEAALRLNLRRRCVGRGAAARRAPPAPPPSIIARRP